VSNARDQLLDELALRIERLAPGRRILVAIDGVDGAGKTWLADELAARLAARRPVVRASVDGFHQPAVARYRRGRDSPLGFYLDSYDYPVLAAALLDPFRAEGDCPYRSEMFDHVTDQPVDAPQRSAEPNAVLLLDGIFLHRPELASCWDLSLWLSVDFAVSVPRGAARGYGESDPAATSNRRYVEGQQHYLATVDPARLADLVIDNNDLDRPFVVGPGPDC
jgi:uridine kinase